MCTQLLLIPSFRCGQDNGLISQQLLFQALKTLISQQINKLVMSVHKCLSS